jgi:hypothetical protein
MNLPPVFLAKSQLNKAVLAPPICKYPVGDGAKRVTIIFNSKNYLQKPKAKLQNPYCQDQDTTQTSKFTQKALKITKNKKAKKQKLSSPISRK